MSQNTETNKNSENIQSTENTENIKVETKERKKEYGVFTHVLREPFKFEEKEYEKIELNFAKLKGKDVMSIEQEMRAEGDFAISPEMSRSFLIKMCSRASGMPSAALINLPIKDFTALTNLARNFLTRSGF